MKSLASLIFLFSSAALALTQTEQTLTPRGQQFELRGGANYEYMDIGLDDSGTATSNGFIIPVTAVYGLNDSNAIGFGFNYESTTIDQKPFGLPTYKSKTKGFESFDILYKGNFDLRSLTIYVDANLSIPPEKASVNNVTSDYSASHGQIAMGGRVGLLMPVSMLKLGALLGYQFNMEGDGTFTNNVYNNLSVKVTGGNEISAQIFGEIENAYNPNVSLIYTSVDKTELKNSGNTLSTTLKRDTLTFRGSLRFIATENLDLIPYASYGMVMNKGDYTADKWNIFTVGADARFLF